MCRMQVCVCLRDIPFPPFNVHCLESGVATWTILRCSSHGITLSWRLFMVHFRMRRTWIGAISLRCLGWTVNYSKRGEYIPIDTRDPTLQNSRYVRHAFVLAESQFFGHGRGLQVADTNAPIRLLGFQWFTYSLMEDADEGCHFFCNMKINPRYGSYFESTEKYWESSTWRLLSYLRLHWYDDVLELG